MAFPSCELCKRLSKPDARGRDGERMVTRSNVDADVVVKVHRKGRKGNGPII